MKIEATYEHNVAAWIKFVSRWQIYFSVVTWWYPMDTCVYCCWPKLNWVFVDASFIACISLFVLQDQNDSLRRRANSQFTSKQFAWTASASRRTRDREELIAKKEILLVQDYRSRLPVENFPILQLTKVTGSVDSGVSTDGAARNTSRAMNEPITSIPKNSPLLWKIHFK